MATQTTKRGLYQPGQTDYVKVETDINQNMSNLDDAVPDSRKVNGHPLSSDVVVTKGDVGLGNADNTSDADKPVSTAQQTALDAKISTSQKGVAGGVAELDANGKVPVSQIPGAVDEIIEGYLYNGSFYYDVAHTQVITPEAGKIYVDLTQNKTYRWSGSVYTEISASLALGETSSTAFYGDKGKTAYDHAMAKGAAFASGLYKITTNSEGHVTAAVAANKADIGLGNVDNTSDADKPVSTAQQQAVNASVAAANRAEAARDDVLGMTVSASGLLEGSNPTVSFVQGNMHFGIPKGDTGDPGPISPVMTGATSSTAGLSGNVPAPAAGDEDKVLKGDGTWGTSGLDPSDIANNMTTTEAGKVLDARQGKVAKDMIDGLAASMGIVEDGDTATHAIAKGQYVIWKKALYTADAAITVGTTLVATGGSKNLTAVENGGLNALNASSFHKPDYTRLIHSIEKSWTLQSYTVQEDAIVYYQGAGNSTTTSVLNIQAPGMNEGVSVGWSSSLMAGVVYVTAGTTISYRASPSDTGHCYIYGLLK